MKEGLPRGRGLTRRECGSAMQTREQTLCSICLPRQAILRLDEPEKSYCKLLGDFRGPVVACFVARFVKCPCHAQSMV